MKTIILVLVTVIAANPVFAQTKASRAKKAAPVAQADSEDVVHSSPSQSTSGKSVNILLGGTFNLLAGFVPGFGANIDIGFKVLKNADWYLGVASGFNAYITSPMLIVIPMMMSNRYQFNISDASVAPYIGLDLGVNIGAASGVGAGAGFGMAFRPGLKFANDSMFFESRLGIASGLFVFAPTIGASF